MKKVLAHFIGLLLVCVLGIRWVVADNLPATTPAKAGYDGAKLSGITERLDKLYDNGNIPNYVLAVAKDGEIFFETIRGNKDVKTDSPVGLDTIYLVASMTKPIATTAALILVDEGKLSLDDNLTDYFPQFDGLIVAPGGSFDSTFEEMNRPITIKDLVTHTSGFTYGESVTGYGDVAKQYDELFERYTEK